MRGLNVLEISASPAAAYCSRLFATAGSDVVMLEPQAGSQLRSAPPWVPAPRTAGPDPGQSATHEFLNAYKRSVALDPDDPRIDELLSWADLVISSTNGVPDDAARLQQRIRAANPSAVHVVISGFGLTGRWAAWQHTDLVDWAAGGHLYITGDPAREPLQGGGPWDTYLAGATAAIGAQAAIFDARRTGAGQLVDVGVMEALASAHQWSLTMFPHTGVVKRRWGNRLGESHHPMSLFPCADGWVCIGAATGEQWENLCIAIDRAELLADDRLYAPAERFDRADEIDAELLPWLGARSTKEVVDLLQQHRVPASRVLTMTEVLHDPQLDIRDFWARPDHLGPNAAMPGAPFRLGDARLPFRRAPRLGEHTDEVLRAAVARPNPAPPTSRPNTGQPATDRLLHGVRVLEFSIAWAGPLTGRYLADFGADVIKIEHPTARGVGISSGIHDEPPAWRWGTLPDPQVRAGVFPNATPGAHWWNRMGVWNKMNRGKRSLCLDVKTPDGERILHRLVEQADVVLNNYSPRGVRSLGIDHETLSAINPNIITISMSGYGATGPMASHISWGPILEAHSGFDEATGYAGGPPCRLGVAYPDAVGGVHGTFALLAALWERDQTGRGLHVDLSQLETLCLLGGELFLASSITGQPPERRGNRSAAYAPQGVYPCAGDDAWVALSVTDDDTWARLVELVDRPTLRRADWATAGQRADAHDEIDAELSGWTVRFDPFDAAAQLQAAGVAAAPAMTNGDLVNCEHLRDRGFMATWDQPDNGPMTYPGFPIHYEDLRPVLRPAPLLGQHNAEIVTELAGYQPDDLARLEAAGVLATRPPG